MFSGITAKKLNKSDSIIKQSIENIVKKKK